MKTEQIKQILADVPDRSTHVSLVIQLPNTEPTPVYVRHRNADTWLRYYPEKNNYGMMKKSGINFLKNIHSLSDLREILALREENEQLKARVSELNKKASL